RRPEGAQEGGSVRPVDRVSPGYRGAARNRPRGDDGSGPRGSRRHYGVFQRGAPNEHCGLWRGVCLAERDIWVRVRISLLLFFVLLPLLPGLLPVLLSLLLPLPLLRVLRLRERGPRDRRVLVLVPESADDRTSHRYRPPFGRRHRDLPPAFLPDAGRGTLRV